MLYITETLRRYSVLPALFRVANSDYAVPGHQNYIIEKGTPIIIPSHAIHHDANIYAEPNTFDPGNFAADKVKQRDSVTWLPFGEGPRNCIGLRFGQMQSRLGLAMLLKNFRFSVGSKTQIPVEIDKGHHMYLNKAGIYLKVERV